MSTQRIREGNKKGREKSQNKILEMNLLLFIKCGCWARQIFFHSPIEKAQKWPGGRSPVCPKCFRSSLFTRMCTLLLWIIRGVSFHVFYQHKYLVTLRNCNKSLDILDFYPLPPCCWTIRKSWQ